MKDRKRKWNMQSEQRVTRSNTHIIDPQMVRPERKKGGEEEPLRKHTKTHVHKAR